MKKERFEGDPIEVLRGADPIRDRDMPKDTTGAHARALFKEITTMDTNTITETPVRKPQRRPLVLAVAAVAAVAMVGLAMINARPADTPPIHIAGGEAIASLGMCVETYDLGTLAGRDIAFDGVLTSTAGGGATFTVNTWFTGGTGPETLLDGNGLVDSISSAGGPALTVGERYLVSGSGGFVWACGFTMTYDTDIAAEWATVFGG